MPYFPEGLFLRLRTKWTELGRLKHRRTRVTKSVDSTSTDRASWLLIFDNVEDPDILKEFWPSFGEGSILITSRDPYSKNQEFAAAASGADLKPFGLEGAADFLIKLTSQEEEIDNELVRDATEIATNLGGLSLAITQMAAIINRQALSLKEFLDGFCEENLRDFHSLRLGVQSRNYEHSLASVWAFDRLDSKSSALLDTLSFLDAGPMADSILKTGCEDIELKEYPKITPEYQHARSILVHSSLVTINKRSATLLIHRLTQDVARARMDNKRLRAIFETAVCLVSKAWEPAPLHKKYELKRWRDHEAILPHVTRLRGLYQSYPQIAPASVRFAQVLCKVAWYVRSKFNCIDKYANFSGIFNKEANAMIMTPLPHLRKISANHKLSKPTKYFVHFVTFTMHEDRTHPSTTSQHFVSTNSTRY
jgi:hypothetical protein